MTSHTETTAETDATQENTEPEFVLATFPDGTITISVEGFGDDVDGLPIMTFTQYGGVEKGQSTIFATSGHSSFFVFHGTYAEQKQVFDRWFEMAEENKRPLVYRDEGIKALVGMGPASYPPFPEFDTAGSEDMNKLAQVADQLATEYEAKLGRALTEQENLDVVRAVSAAAA